MVRALLATLVVLAAVATGCGSSEPSVQLEGGTDAAGGKAMVFSATTDEKLASEKGGLFAVELRGIDADSANASFDAPDYVDVNRCIKSPCAWTVAPDKAGAYKFKAVLIDLRSDKATSGSDPVELTWTAPTRPREIKLFVNGTTPPTWPLVGGDDYSDFPTGPMNVEATWSTDVQGTGYYVRISVGNRVYAKCSTGTSCRVPEPVPLAVEKLVSWVVQLRTTQGDKVAGGFRVCLEGEKPKAA
jgi:hypothetical protein